jgi:predicted HTH domain antitoxin
MNITFELPDVCVKGHSEYDIKMLLANKLYEAGIIGTSIGAEIVGIHRTDFMLKMGKYGIGILNISEEELDRELDNARKIGI